MKTFEVQFIVSRNDPNEITFALVTANVNRTGLKNEINFLNALTRSISEWIKTSDAGKMALEDSSENFNVGDLSNWTEELSLKKCLENEGITEFNVDITSKNIVSTNWMYDTVLADINEDISIPDDDNGEK